MVDQHLFSGRAIAAVDAAGRFTLPGFIRDVLEQRSQQRLICFGVHERDACLLAYDASYSRALFEDIERRRIGDEAAGRSGADHHSRMRRMFGFVEHAAFDADGLVVLPALLRRKAMIRKTALLIGVGGGFELWNPRIARDAADPQVRELADLRVRDITDDEREMMA